jgi:hypothetical protein
MILGWAEAEEITRNTANTDNTNTMDHLPARAIIRSFACEDEIADRTFSPKKSKSLIEICQGKTFLYCYFERFILKRPLKSGLGGILTFVSPRPHSGCRRGLGLHFA